MTLATTDGPRPVNNSKGSAMSTKQLTKTVTEGRLITVRLQDGTEHRGYLCGMDDFHWMVITPDATKHLVHKGSASLVTLEESATYDTEPNKAALEEVVGPFRSWVARNNSTREGRST